MAYRTANAPTALKATLVKSVSLTRIFMVSINTCLWSGLTALPVHVVASQFARLRVGQGKSVMSGYFWTG